MVTWFVRHLLHCEADITGKSCSVNDSRNQFSLERYSPDDIHEQLQGKPPVSVYDAGYSIFQSPEDQGSYESAVIAIGARSDIPAFLKMRKALCWTFRLDPFIARLTVIIIAYYSSQFWQFRQTSPYS